MSFRLFYLPISTRRFLIYACPLGPPAPGRGLVDRAVHKTNALWAKWEHSDVSWQKTVVRWGNKAFARIPYPEWGLKSVPPLTGRAQGSMEEVSQAAPISMSFPRRMVSPAKVHDDVRGLVTEKMGFHRRWLWRNVAGLPLTIPFILVPM